MDASSVNWLAVVVAALAMFGLGGIWYSPMLFAKGWQKAAGVTDAQLKNANMGVIFGIAFIFALVMAASLAFYLADPATDLTWGMTAGFLAGFGWVFLSIGTLMLFERRPWSYLFINGGYFVVGFVIMGAIIGAWR
jgi:hypothetical protein